MIDDCMIVCKSLPNKVTAMILHSKYRRGGEILIEATLIRNGGIDADYMKALFKIDPIHGWLQTSKAKPIVNLIEINMFGGQARQPLQPPFQLSQLSQRSHPPVLQPPHYHMSQQFSQLSQPTLDMLQQYQLSQELFMHNPSHPMQNPFCQPADNDHSVQEMGYGNTFI
jgi:hypothetical protein